MEVILENDNRTKEEVIENKKRMERVHASNEGKTINCEICDGKFLPNELKSTDDNENVCPECFSTEECGCCSKRFPKDDLHTLCELNGDVSYEHICSECEENVVAEATPTATVFYNDDEYPQYITDYRDETDGDFVTKYVATDGWRGYFDVEPGENSDFAHIHSDCALAYSADAEELKKFDDEFQETLRRMGIKYARVFTRTSNVFSQGYDFFVEKSRLIEAGAIRVMLALKYRDPERFKSTALTGADPEDQTDNDKHFVKAVELLENGMTPEQAVEKVLAEVKN